MFLRNSRSDRIPSSYRARSYASLRLCYRDPRDARRANRVIASVPPDNSRSTRDARSAKRSQCITRPLRPKRSTIFSAPAIQAGYVQRSNAASRAISCHRHPHIHPATNKKRCKRPCCFRRCKKRDRVNRSTRIFVSGHRSRRPSHSKHATGQSSPRTASSQLSSHIQAPAVQLQRRRAFRPPSYQHPSGSNPPIRPRATRPPIAFDSTRRTNPRPLSRLSCRAITACRAQRRGHPRFPPIPHPSISAATGIGPACAASPLMHHVRLLMHFAHAGRFACFAVAAASIPPANASHHTIHLAWPPSQNRGCVASFSTAASTLFSADRRRAQTFPSAYFFLHSATSSPLLAACTAINGAPQTYVPPPCGAIIRRAYCLLRTPPSHVAPCPSPLCGDLIAGLDLSPSFFIHLTTVPSSLACPNRLAAS